MRKITMTDGAGWSQDFWLMTAAPDWSSEVEMTLEMRGETARGLGARESGRAVFERLRVSDFSYTAMLDGAAARELRAGLAARRTEPLLVPIWPLARRSSELAAEAWRSEIYAVYEMVDDAPVLVGQYRGRNVFSHASVTGETFTVPCLVADFAGGEWPQMALPDDESIEVELNFEEAGSADFALTLVGVTSEAGPVPTGWLGGVPRIFPLGVDWSSAPGVRYSHELGRDRVGASRVETLTDQGALPERLLEWKSQAMDGSEVARLAAFFIEMGGVAGRFWAPGLAAVGRLTQDVVGSSVDLTVEGAEAVAAGDWLAAVDAGGERVQVAQVQSRPPSGPMTLVSAVTDLVAERTSLVEAVMVRFSKTKLRLSWTSDESADARITVRELPWETLGLQGGTMGRAAVRTSLYTLRDVATGTIWRYTSFERALVFSGNTFIPYPISHGPMRQTITLEDECELEAEVRKPGPFWGLQKLEIARLSVKIERVMLTSGVVTSVVRTFEGDVGKVGMRERVMKLTVRGQRKELDEVYPRMRFSRLCSYSLFGPGCGVSKAAWTLAGTVASLSDGGRTVGVTLAVGRTCPVSFFAWGYLVLPGGRRAGIINSTAMTGGTAVSLTIEPVAALVTGMAVQVVPECDGRTETCRVFENFLNFGGNQVAQGNLSLVKVSTNLTNKGKK